MVSHGNGTTPVIILDDPGDYERAGIPHEQFAWLRANAPVYWHEPNFGDGWPGFWAVTRHADVQYVSRHPELFSSQRRLAVFYELPDEHIERQRHMMLHMDPPRHSRLRALVNRGFTARVIERLATHVREVCDSLLDEVVARGDADFVRDIAAPLPLYVTCELIGAPLADREYLFQLTCAMRGADDPVLTRSYTAQEATTMAYEYITDLAAQRKAEPRDDILTMVLRADERGDALSADELNMFFLLLVVAGSETTRNAAAGGMRAFFEYPEQWRRLLADRALTGTAAEEIVRWTSPVNMFRRTATQDTELAGRRIAEGDKVVVYYSSANRDEDVFTDPSTFDIGRDPNPHLGFGGGGPHFCLGRQLAALELRVLLDTIADRMPDIRPAGEAHRLPSIFANGLTRLPVRFTPSDSVTGAGIPGHAPA
jgi:cholest-4-en-3-one 26-monooxygenase